MEPGPGTMLTATLRLERELGRGGMGSVWRARHLGLGADVAVKLVAPELLCDEVIRERFAREARAAAHIRSPHVVAILDFGTSADGTPYITMDLCQGETLRRRLARLGRLEPRAAVRVVAGVTLGLEAAHALGIVHRDIKPENVLFDGPDDTVKLLDFGIAKRSDTGERILTMADAVMGTPAYMSPEQLLFPGKVEPAFDLWAVAVVAYEMLTGVNPFDAAVRHGAGSLTGFSDLLQAICHGSYAPASSRGASPAFDAFFAQALALEPGARFGNAGALRRAFDSAARAARDESSRPEPDTPRPAPVEPAPVRRELRSREAATTAVRGGIGGALAFAPTIASAARVVVPSPPPPGPGPTLPDTPLAAPRPSPARPAPPTWPSPGGSPRAARRARRNLAAGALAAGVLAGAAAFVLALTHPWSRIESTPPGAATAAAASLAETLVTTGLVARGTPVARWVEDLRCGPVLERMKARGASIVQARLTTGTSCTLTLTLGDAGPFVTVLATRVASELGEAVVTGHRAAGHAIAYVVEAEVMVLVAFGTPDLAASDEVMLALLTP